jgi:hypothetical protein
MPFTPHPEYPLWKTDRLKLWRYMPLTRLRDVLNDGALFFCNVVELAEMDKMEGFLSSGTVEDDKRAIRALPEPERSRRMGNLLHYLACCRMFRGWVCVSCWHRSDHESVSMWNQYAGGRSGVAVQTTLGVLKEAFNEADDSVFMGTIKYVDFTKFSMPPAKKINAGQPFLHKRECFKSEKEMRAFVVNPAYSGSKGMLIQVDLKRLVKRVVLSPGSPVGRQSQVQKLLSRHGLTEMQVHPSELDDSPAY